MSTTRSVQTIEPNESECSDVCTHTEEGGRRQEKSSVRIVGRWRQFAKFGKKSPVSTWSMCWHSGDAPAARGSKCTRQVGVTLFAGGSEKCYGMETRFGRLCSDADSDAHVVENCDNGSEWCRRAIHGSVQMSAVGGREKIVGERADGLLWS